MMKMDAIELAQLAQADAEPRYDIYAGIHKAARAMFADSLLALGRMDADDDAERADALARLDALLDFCGQHLAHENAFIHPAMEARAAGTSEALAHEHDDHRLAIEALRGLARRLDKTPLGQRAGLAHVLYLRLSAFVAHNLEHMLIEETAHNAVLWAHYSDAEIAGIEGAIHAALSPEESAFALRWMLGALSHPQRLALLADLRFHAPAPVFEGALGLAREVLDDTQWARLSRGLGLAPAPGLAA